ncbi:MAG: phospho-N-acetylmuramoyl-pentapeptide-transferase [Oscillospiraceae bacterium]|nr:phospho-N-acetylmuramoyl-pentapeptide-transferase [Oscillospiraceae bacterium]
MPIWITMGAAITALVLAGAGGLFLIPFLRKIHFGQTILDIGPAWHKAKQGTPIMGGFLFLFGSVAATVIGYLAWRLAGGADPTAAETSSNAIRLLTVILFSMLFSSIGFADDYIKAVKKQNLGLNAKQKMAAQIVLSAALLGTLYALGDRETTIDLLFWKPDFGLLYYPIMVAFIVYISNAVNLTDGVDGLCGTVTVISMLSMTVLCALQHEKELSLYAITLAGGCLGFLIWNLHPAKCFMGDTGSMYLGGAFAALGIACRMHLLLVLVGMVYVLDAFSVVLQVLYFKITARMHYKKTGEKGKGKRIFKMSPIHHHFELCAWSEYKIVVIFSLFGLLCGLLAIGRVVWL